LFAVLVIVCAFSIGQVKEIIRREEDLFTRTLTGGLTKFERICKNKKHGDTLTGAETFLLYGTAIDLSELVRFIYIVFSLFLLMLLFFKVSIVMYFL
jgi:hypothetical protein